MRAKVLTCAIAAWLGFALDHIGFSSWDEVHRMFVFADLRMFLTFVGAVVLLIPTWIVVARLTGARWSPRRIHGGTLFGGLLFGTGWALSGACPAIALVQLGTGSLFAVFTLLGIFAGNALYPHVHERVFGWTSGNCLDD
jgi:uncharacterized membrane protein YedE/YeeE